MQTKHLCVLIHIWTKGEVGAVKPVKPSSKTFLLTVPRRHFFCGSFVFLCLVFLMILRLFIAALWSPTGKGLTSWLLLVIFIVFLLLSNVVSWFRFGTWLYLFLIFASFLTLIYSWMKVQIKLPKVQAIFVDFLLFFFCQIVLVWKTSDDLGWYSVTKKTD